MKCLVMSQVSQYGWRLVSLTGVVLQKDLYFSSIEKAAEYAKNYVSSFHNWTYEIETLADQEEDVC